MKFFDTKAKQGKAFSSAGHWKETLWLLTHFSLMHLAALKEEENGPFIQNSGKFPPDIHFATLKMTYSNGFNFFIMENIQVVKKYVKPFTKISYKLLILMLFKR